MLAAILVLGYVLLGKIFNPPVTNEQTNTDINIPEEEMKIITVKHGYKEGRHIYAGEIIMPTPCDALEWKINEDKSTESEKLAEFISVNKSEVCAQIITAARFKIEFESREETKLKATLDGVPVKLNVIEVGPDENLDDFEIFIKG